MQSRSAIFALRKADSPPSHGDTSRHVHGFWKPARPVPVVLGRHELVRAVLAAIVASACVASCCTHHAIFLPQKRANPNTSGFPPRRGVSECTTRRPTSPDLLAWPKDCEPCIHASPVGLLSPCSLLSGLNPNSAMQ